MTDLKKLRELANKADKGPWRWLNCRTLVGDYDSRPVILTSNDFLEVRNRKTGLLELASVDGPNESFIAAANPETVIALIDMIEKLELQLKEANAVAEFYGKTRLYVNVGCDAELLDDKGNKARAYLKKWEWK